MQAGVGNLHPPVNNEFSVVVTLIKVVIVSVFLLPLVHYTIFKDVEFEEHTKNVSKRENTPVIFEADRIMNATVEEKSEKEDGKVAIVMNILVQEQPSCPKSQMLSILEEICMEIVMRKSFCTPEDFHNRDKHKIPKHYARNSYSSSKQAPQLPAIVNWALGGLLVTSLAAALIELYKAKRHPEKKNGKNPLSRKCSLADLTVLKHHRKEMVRRDSLMEVREEGLYAKQLGSSPPPLHRRCSFPVGPGIPSFNRRLSLARSGEVVDGRRPSVIFDSRKQSVVIESRRTSVAGSLSCGDESPERRHHTRLVHRH